MTLVILKLHEVYYKGGRWDVKKEYILVKKNSRFPETIKWFGKAGRFL
jgi:hypothetical protein